MVPEFGPSRLCHLGVRFLVRSLHPLVRCPLFHILPKKWVHSCEAMCLYQVTTSGGLKPSPGGVGERPTSGLGELVSGAASISINTNGPFHQGTDAIHLLPVAGWSLGDGILRAQLWSCFGRPGVQRQKDLHGPS